MKYMGSKRRVANDILNVMFNIVETDENTIFYDVFCGGGNLIQEVPLKNRVAIDLNEYVIEALRVIKLNPYILPKDRQDFINMVKQYAKDKHIEFKTGKEAYNYMKEHLKEYPKWFIGYIGTTCAFGAKFLSTWARGTERNGKKRDYVRQAYNSAIVQHKRIQCVDFICKEYDKYDYIKENSIVYCDPPYSEASKYPRMTGFKSSDFYNWIRHMSKQGYNIFFSEFSAPEDFVEIWSKELLITTHKTRYSVKVDKLFTTEEVLSRNNVDKKDIIQNRFKQNGIFAL